MSNPMSKKQAEKIADYVILYCGKYKVSMYDFLYEVSKDWNRINKLDKLLSAN